MKRPRCGADFCIRPPAETKSLRRTNSFKTESHFEVGSRSFSRRAGTALYRMGLFGTGTGLPDAFFLGNSIAISGLVPLCNAHRLSLRRPHPSLLNGLPRKSVQNPYKSDHFRERDFSTAVRSTTCNVTALKCTDSSDAALPRVAQTNFDCKLSIMTITSPSSTKGKSCRRP